MPTLWGQWHGMVTASNHGRSNWLLWPLPGYAPSGVCLAMCCTYHVFAAFGSLLTKLPQDINTHVLRLVEQIRLPQTAWTKYDVTTIILSRGEHAPGSKTSRILFVMLVLATNVNSFLHFNTSSIISVGIRLSTILHSLVLLYKNIENAKGLILSLHI